MLDPILLAAVIPRPIRYLGKAELWKVPGFGWWLGTIGAIPVNRGRSDLAAIRFAIEALEADEVVGIFPEGGVGREGPWLRGAARMALATGSPLLPVRLLGTRKAFGRGRIAFPPLAALIGEPIAVARTEPHGGAGAGADRPAAGCGRAACGLEPRRARIPPGAGLRQAL